MDGFQPICTRLFFPRAPARRKMYFVFKQAKGGNNPPFACLNFLLFYADNPALGHPGRLPGTRELVVSGTPYIVPYRVSGRPERVEILRVFHAARRLPERW